MSSSFGAAQPPSAAAAAVAATTTDQVTIDVENGILNENDQINMGLIAVDGRRHGHQRHGSGGSHHHSGHDSDADDVRRPSGNRQRHHHRRRSRSRSRSPSPAPPHRTKRATDTGTPPTEKDIVNNTRDVEPLLVTHNTDVHHKKHTELDEDSDEGSTQHEQNPGVDDGFFVGNRPDIEGGGGGGGGGGVGSTDDYPVVTNNHVPNDIPSYPYSPGYNPNVILDANGNPQIIPDINVYQQKKNLAQGMMDLALLSANANQLRYVVETYARHPYYWFSLISISISLILQVAVGVGLILNSRYNVKNKEQICRADKINNFTVIGIFLITAVNVFITAFGVAPLDNSRPN